MSETSVVVVDDDMDGQPLTVAEEKRLAELETKISSELVGAFYEVGKALAEIRDGKLYREKHRTFEGYCRKFFELAKTRAYELISAAFVYDDLAGGCTMSANGGQKILPANERQIRPLLKIEDKKSRSIVWKLAVGSALESKKAMPSGGMVTRMVKDFLGEVAETRIKVIKDEVPVSRQINADLKQAFDLLTDEIRKAKAEGYKSAPRLAIIKIIDGLRRLLADDGDQVQEPRILHANREKLLKAGFTFYRCNRQTLVIEKEDSSHFDWQHVSAHTTADEMDLAMDGLLMASNQHLQD